jgi:hypothetical protein
MASIKYGSIITDIRGSVGGNVFQRNQSGNTIRNKSRTAGTRSLFRQFSTTHIAYLAQLWRTLSDIDRSAWSTASMDWIFYDRFGDPYFGTGYQYFLAANKAQLDMGLSIYTSPPALESPTDFTLIEILLRDDGSYSIEWDSSISSFSNIQVFSTGVVSAGRAASSLKFKLLTNFVSSDALVFDSPASYLGRFPVPAIGSRVWFRLVSRGLSRPYPVLINQSFVDVISA